MRRKLLKSGESVMRTDDAVKVVMMLGELPSYVKTIPSRDSALYKQYYGKSIDWDGEDTFEVKQPDNASITRLKVLTNDPKDSNIPLSVHMERVNEELSWFMSNGYLPLICSVIDLIDEFRKDGIVWGSRGSSCASYVLYLLGVHDVNPLEYDIPFSDITGGNSESE